jgi:hypothetical protein
LEKGSKFNLKILLKGIHSTKDQMYLQYCQDLKEAMDSGPMEGRHLTGSGFVKYKL